MNLSLKRPSIKGTFLEISIGSPWFLVLCILNWNFEWLEQIKKYKSQFSPKNSARFARSTLQVKYFSSSSCTYNYRTIVIISFISQEYLHVFMYIMCFNVSICFKMGSLYSYCGIITKLVYPRELSRIAGFCTYSNKIFLGADPQTPLFKQNYLRLYYNHNTAFHLKKVKNTYPNPPPPHHFSGKLKIKWSVYVLFQKSIVDHFSANGCLKEQRKVLENSLKMYLKSPWKVLENGMSWSVGTVRGKGMGVSYWDIWV